MDTSRRAVESYWRSRMIDGVTADEDKVAPVYKLEEICELLRTSHASIVKEASEFILKRLDHKSPIVKQKTLRLIKYSVGKSGAEFRREMQRHSAAVRQLLHYKGNLDPLKGDALNKAVRDTAQETIAALFASDDNKAAVQVENINKRIEGFGNTNYEVPTEEKKSFLSEVVGLGSASIIQGLTSLAVTHSLKKPDSGTYKSPNLRRSLTTEMDSRDRYEPVDEHYGDKWQSYGSSKNAMPVSWNPDSRNSLSTSVNEDNSSNHVMTRSREERLLETIVTSGGVRLQPTRDALQAFLSEASKLDPLAMSRAIELKLQSHLWQVRMKAICVLESILRKKDDDCFSIIESYFSENNDTVVKCCELPQASLRDKANKVFSLLSGSQNSSAGTEDPIDGTLKSAPAIQMPDLIDTFDPDNDDESVVNHAIEDLTSAPLVDDLFGDAPPIPDGKNETEDDPFAGVSFHVSDEKRHSDIFSGLTIDDRKSDQIALGGNRPELDLFGPDSWHAHADNGSDKTKNAQDLMAGFDLSGMNQGNSYGSVQIEGNNSSQHGLQLPSNGALKDDAFNSSNSYYPMPGMMMQYGMQPNLLFNPVLMGAYIAQQQQQQLLYQSMGSFNPGYINVATDSGGHSSALPDIFQISGNAAAPNLNSPMVMASSKKDETKAFDFISEHMSAARDSKRIL